MSNFVLLTYWTNHTRQGHTRTTIVPVKDVFARLNCHLERGQSVTVEVNSKAYFATVLLVNADRGILESHLECIKMVISIDTTTKRPHSPQMKREDTSNNSNDSGASDETEIFKKDEVDSTSPEKRYSKKKLKKKFNQNLYIECLLKRHKQSHGLIL